MICRSDIMKNVHSLPVIPVAAIQTVKLIQDKDVSFERLVDTIKYDPIITAKVIRMANSALLSGSRPISSVKEALVRLGLKQLMRLVIASSVKPVLNQSLPGYDLGIGELWRHSVAVGITAEIIETRKGEAEGDIAFTVGLLHDIGKLAMGSFVEKYIQRILEVAMKENIPFEEAETDVLGIDHTELGAVLLERWGFPEEIIEVVRWHHLPDKDSSNRRAAIGILAQRQ